MRAGVERKTENRIGSSAASARTCFDGDDDDYHHFLGDGDEDDELNSVFELTHYDNDKATMMTRER